VSAAAEGGGQALWAMSATELAAAIRAKEISPVEVIDAVLTQIDRLNPAINAFVTVTDDIAREQASAAEAAVMRGEELGLIHGVPYSIKDMTPTKGIRTTSGSKLFEHYVPTQDAILVERLRGAGGVLVGKTNTPDLAAKCTTDNKIFGPTRNPWALGLTPGGSSGGAAASVAVGMAPLAEGSDHAGSVRCPAALCGVVGLKPSDGRVPFYPNNMLWQPVTMCNGPITRTVADAALMLDVMAGPDDRDPRSLCDDARDFSGAVAGAPSLAGMRVGYLGDLGCVPIDPAVSEVCEVAVAAFTELGCEVEHEQTDFSDTVQAYGLINATRRAASTDPYLPDRAGDLDPEVVWRAELAGSKTATDLGKAVITQTSAYERVRSLLQRYDLLLTPTTPTPAFPIEVGDTGGYPLEIAGVKINNVFEQLGLTFLFNLTGHPAISVPAGWTNDGLPIGLQIVGPWRDDAAVLRAAAAYERARPWRDRWPLLATNG
jgi:Asp-tRNA(Asn)/Glu-tRNA(Gln) amidotransferase A subunit family amidase